MSERDWKAAFEEEHEIVARIWKQLGSPTYSELNGRTIYDLIEELKAPSPPLEAEPATSVDAQALYDKDVYEMDERLDRQVVGSVERGEDAARRFKG